MRYSPIPLIKLVCLCLILGLALPVSASQDSIKVVTSFSILEDLVKQLGGEHVKVVNLVGRNSDAHTYKPKPSDAVAIANADLVILNGLSFEGWIARLIKNGDEQKVQLIASKGVEPLMHDGDIDPHAWQSFHNIRIYIDNISQTLTSLLPQYAAEFKQRQTDYLTALNQLENELISQLATIPVNKRIVVTSHDAFAYFGREFDIQFLAPVGVSLEEEASAEDVAVIIDQIHQQNVKALFVENINNPRLLDVIASETGVAIGGRLYSDALSELDGPADSYLNMMRHNFESLIKAFQ